MTPTADLTANLTWDWQDWRGRDHEADIEVFYSFDGEAIRSWKLNYDPGFDEAEADRLIDHIESEYAPEAYAEWLAEWRAERGEYLRDRFMDRSAA